MKPEIGWAIKGNYGLYIGWWMTRRAAIGAHCREKGRTWRDCRKHGDRVIKVKISEVKP